MLFVILFLIVAIGIAVIVTEIESEEKLTILDKVVIKVGSFLVITIGLLIVCGAIWVSYLGIGALINYKSKPKVTYSDYYVNFKSIGQAILKYNNDGEAQIDFYSADNSYRFRIIDADTKSTMELMDKVIYSIYKQNIEYYLSYECTTFLKAVEGAKSGCKTDNTLPMCTARCEIYRPKFVTDKNAVTDYSSYIITKRIADNYIN